MKVILKSFVDNLGDAGDIVDVANGYATNFLIPQNLAMRATKGAEADSRALQRSRMKREAVEIAEATEQAKGVTGTVLTIQATAGEDGTLYGSVGRRDIAQALHDKIGLELDFKRIDLDRSIKTVGKHEVGVKLHRDVIAMVIIDVVADEIIQSGAEDLEEALAEVDEVDTTPADTTPADTTPAASAPAAKAADDVTTGEPAEV
ncbi:MAG: 50S ribosomal protein L9 [Euzebya sp.]